VHVPSELIAAYDAEWGVSLLGDKAHTMILRHLETERLGSGFSAGSPSTGAPEKIVAWFDADPANRPVDAQLNHTMRPHHLKPRHED